MADYMIRTTALDGHVRAFALNATTTVDELRRRHDTYPAATAALGRTAMGALLLSAASLKERDQLLTIDIRGGGPIGRVLATANGGGEVRGLVGNPHSHADSVGGKLNVGGVVGRDGYLAVTKDLGMREPYRGTVELVSGEIGEDLAHYLLLSEQTPSAVGIGVFVRPDTSVDAAGGYLLQLMPGIPDDAVAEIEGVVAGLPHPTTMLREGLSPEDILARIFGGNFAPPERQSVAFGCPCSRERFERAIVTLGREEIQGIIDAEEGDMTEVVCHFCNEAYLFSAADMGEILEAAR